MHRDIKAANVVLTRRGGLGDVAKVLDFGLVHAVGDEVGEELVGTPAYLAPEGFSAPDEVDARSDLYSLGVLGWFLLAGRLPFEADSLPALCNQHLFTDPAPLPASVPAALAEVVMACLAKDPAARPDSAAEVARSIAPVAAPWTPERAEAWWSDVPKPGAGGPFDDSETLEVALPAIPARRSR